jgi:hypothetical protein
LDDPGATGPNASAEPEGCPATDGGEAAPVEERTASAQPRADSAAPAPARELPKIAEKADDLEAIKQAVDDAAAVGGGLWLSYLAVAAGAVTHADLFFENPVKLPFLNIELPLLAFFFLAPILFIVVHAYTLVHLVMLTDKAKRFDTVLRKQIGDENVSVRDSLRRQLPSNIFIQFLAGPADIRESAFGWLLRAIAWVTLVIAPVLLLLLMQIQFLPFHDSFITWTHRLALFADVVLIWWLWREILSGREVLKKRPIATVTWGVVGLAFSILVLLFSWPIATFPGEWQEDRLLELDSSGRVISFRDRIFKSPVDPTTRRRRLPLSNTLVLTGLNVLEDLGVDDPDKAKWRDFVCKYPPAKPGALETGAAQSGQTRHPGQ